MSRQIRFVKAAARGKGGAVAAKNQVAADLGARILSRGGNAVDAAVAVGLALAVLEPWTSGLGAIGSMTIWDARKHRGIVVDFPGIIAPRIKEAESAWPGLQSSEGDSESAQRAEAYASIAVPGLPDGLWTAHSFGSKPWPALVAPAIEISEEGLEVDWYAYLAISTAAAQLARFPASRALFVPSGLPSSFRRPGRPYKLINPPLTGALKSLAERGARDFYEGMIAHEVAADLSRGGSSIDRTTLRDYHARLLEPAVVPYAGRRFMFPPGTVVGQIFSEFMNTGREWRAHVDQSTLVKYAHLFLAARAELTLDGESATDEWSSHVSVIDGDGNIVSLSQTLGSIFGAKVVLPATGILANNGAQAFEPRPSKNGDAGQATRSHLLPVIGLSGDRPWIALGVSGNRHILPTLVQLVAFLSDFGFSVEDAFHQPRIGVGETGEVLVDPTVSHELKEAIRQAFRSVERPVCLYPFTRPCAVVVGVDPYSGECVAMTEVSEVWAGAAAAG